MLVARLCFYHHLSATATRTDGMRQKALSIAGSDGDSFYLDIGIKVAGCEKRITLCTDSNRKCCIFLIAASDNLTIFKK